MLGTGGPGTVHGGHPWRESCHWLASLEAAITLVEDHLAMRPDEGYGMKPVPAPGYTRKKLHSHALAALLVT